MVGLPRLDHLPVSTEPEAPWPPPEWRKQVNPAASVWEAGDGGTKRIIPVRDPARPPTHRYLPAAVLRQQQRSGWLKSLVADVTKQLAITNSVLPMGRSGSGLLNYGSVGPWFAPQWRPGDNFDYAA